ncbi:MAG TPA: SBBP repeat-containing protein [Candidatus Cloacimonadota bacterium]|jgi:hypothetical protein|nr:SBBP repeat-containing protein [Candidatus Cloacimonadota bacterium]HOR58294.1 SBBP repeat-containing protein [Candidatus Cloacimonadota bacterium]HPB08611.1 SBBP repeat-containing protein [Candidatus Cloacimonadota bacterium]HPL23360.1 SBBP repeat-containing protein [Candidatus Cloacimonadota bacterium]HQL12534.1 SBBP repeat-containing protein [Candidatus Cloacimonadota bacterium]
MSIHKLLFLSVLVVISGSLLYAQSPYWSWAKGAGGTGEDICNSVARDNSGNYYVAGSFSGRVSFGSTTLASSGSGDIFVGKLDPSGNWLWARKAGGTLHDVASSIAVDSAGNAYITGNFASSALIFVSSTSLRLNRSGGTDLFVAKINSNGVWQWARKNSGGGTSLDLGNAIAVDANSNVYMTGYFKNTISFTTATGVDTLTAQTSSYYDMLVAKISGSGVWQWAIQGSGATMDQGSGIAVDSQGNAYVTGGFNSPTLTLGNIVIINRRDTTFDGFVAKVSPEGQWLWGDRFGGINADSGSAITVDSSDNIYLTGFFSTSAYFGNLTLTSSGGYDVFAAKLDSSGTWLWARKAGGAGFDEGLGISVDANSNVFLAGRFTGSANFGSTTLTSATGNFSDAFLCKLNSAGDWQWALQAGGTGTDIGYGVVAHGDSEALLCGCFTDSSDFSGTILTSAGMSDAFFARIAFPPPTLTLLSFIGGDSYPANTVQNINWTASWVDSVRLDYSLDGGSTWNTINNGEAVPAALGSCEWNLPNLNNYQAKVRVSDSVNPELFAVSDTTFAIIVPPLAPEAVQVGLDDANPQNFTISWEAVTLNQNGESLVPDGYRIYYCNEFNGDSTVFLLLAEIRDGTCTSYTHNDATLDFGNIFYKIVAFKE